MPTTSKCGASKSGGSNAVARNYSGGKPEQVEELTIRMPNLRRNHHIMRFNAAHNVDFADWHDAEMERENNIKQVQVGISEDKRKFGAGSEYNSDQREEARRKKFGINNKKNQPETRPYILKPGGKGSKKFKGNREGGVNDNCSYYVFVQMADGVLEAHPVDEWYNFQPTRRYNTLSAEEAELEFTRRNKSINYFSLMQRNRLKNDKEEEQDPDEVKVQSVGSAATKALKISEIDEWAHSDDESNLDENDKMKNKKKPKRDVDDEAFEESDDGDEEGREMEYDTESSEDESDSESKISKDLKSVAEEEALRNLLTSDDEEDEEKNKSVEIKNDDEKEKKTENNKENNKKKTPSKKQLMNENKETLEKFSSNSSSMRSSSSNSKRSKDCARNSTNSVKKSYSGKSTTTAPTVANKRKINSMPNDGIGSDNNYNPVSPPAKYAKLEIKEPSLPSSSADIVNANVKDDCGITEERLRRYLMSKPMTSKELLMKFVNEKNEHEAGRLVNTMMPILKKIRPAKQIIDGNMYLSIKMQNVKRNYVKSST